MSGIGLGQKQYNQGPGNWNAQVSPSCVCILQIWNYLDLDWEVYLHRKIENIEMYVLECLYQVIMEKSNK